MIISILQVRGSKERDQGHAARIHPLGLWAPKSMVFLNKGRRLFSHPRVSPEKHKVTHHPIFKGNRRTQQILNTAFLLFSYPDPLPGQELVVRDHALQLVSCLSLTMMLSSAQTDDQQLL